VLFTKTYGRVLGPGLIALDPALPDDLAVPPHRLAKPEPELDRHIDNGLTAA
jgi:hypothetical protein